jgi:Lrp/AsnC family transcriptional regulator, regulator for asnA, asnC and gidA
MLNQGYKQACNRKGKRVPLNDLDSKILKSLLKDGRMGYDQIAKEFKVSKNKIWKHCKAMEKKGIIKGATVQWNFADFGYDALVTLLISVEAQQMEKVMGLIGEITEVRAYRQYNSVYNVRAVATLRDLNELDHVKQVIKRKLPTIGLKTYVWAGVRNISENLSLAKLPRSNFESPEHKKLVNTDIDEVYVDDLDRQIVEKLALNGRSSFSKIAKETGVSTDTIIKRYYKLRKNNAIKVSIQINPNLIGYTSILDFNIAFTTSNGLTDTVVESLAKIPDIIIITKTSGDYDLQLTAMIRDITHSFDIQDQISRICGITKIEASARKIPDKWPTPLQYISTF